MLLLAINIYLFLAALGLCCCKGFLWLWRVGANLHCNIQASQLRRLLLVCGLQTSQLTGPSAWAQQLWHRDSAASEIFPDKALTCVSYTGRWILIHCAAKEVLLLLTIVATLYITSPWLIYFKPKFVPFDSLHPFCPPHPLPLATTKLFSVSMLGFGFCLFWDSTLSKII